LIRRKHRSPIDDEAELDITPFMNIMIVLVPVLLLGLVFSQIAVIDLTLPEAAGGESDQDNKQLELVIREDALIVNYPQGILLKTIPKQEGEYDYKLLSIVLQEVKRQLREKGMDKKAITILSEPTTSYQTIVSVMDTSRSFKAVIATSVVDAELFPSISFGDAPAIGSSPTQGVKP